MSTFGIMMAVGFLVANFLLQKEFRRLGYKEKLADYIIIGAVIAGIAGSKLAFLAEQYESIHSFSMAMNYLFSGGGLTWYGGLILATVTIVFLIKRANLSALHVSDIITPALAAGYGFGRIGCLISGDGCYGQKCDLNLPAPLCDSFPRGAANWNEITSRYNDPNVTVYSTPFYEATASFLFFLFFWALRKKEWPVGFKIYLFIFLHATVRFFVEFIRLNPDNVFGVTQAQFVSIGLWVLCLTFFAVNYKKVIEKIQGGSHG